MADAEMTELAAPKTYALSNLVNAHKGDVKALCLTKSGVIISAGRDENVTFWNKKAGEYSATLHFKQPKGIVVNSLAYAETENGWRLFAGRKDGSMAMYGSGNPDPIQVYKEHENNVCCLHINEKHGVLLSGSWDTHVILWPLNDLDKPEFSALQLVGHSLSVWALASFPEREDYYLTASADKTIRFWKRDETVDIFKGHDDVVRALAVLSNTHFLSAGNDGNIIYWSIEAGTCLGKFKTKSHDFIYSLTLCDSHILTTGEEGTLEFWSIFGGAKERDLKIESELVLQTPSSSTWDSKVLPSSDIAVAGSDGRIFIFSKDPQRHIKDDLREAYDAEIVVKIANQQKSQSSQQNDTVVIKVALDDGPAKMELRYVKGTDPQLTAEKFVTDHQLPISYTNEVVDYICQNIPEARMAREKATRNLQPGQRKMLEGNTYDHVFDVTLENGTVLKMPYNRNEDPDYAAQRFVEKHNLPVKFLGQLSQLIRSEMSGNSAATSDFYDPFTGSGRYVPGGNAGAGAGGYEDPFTGGGRYVPGGAGSGGNSGGFSGDPLTGDGGYRASVENTGQHAVPLSSLPTDKKRPRGPLVPVPDYFLFGPAGASQKVVAKLKEFNEKQESHFQLSPEQISALETLLTVQNLSADSASTAQTAFEIAFQWPIVDLVPVLDFFRIALLHPALNQYFCGDRHRGNELVQKLIAILVSEPADIAVRVFVCRVIANAFSQTAGRNLFSTSELSVIVVLVVKQLENSKPILQLAATSALANWSLSLLQQSQDCAQLGPREDILRAVIGGIENISSFGGISEDALIRLLQTIVTLMWGESNVIKLAKNRDMQSIAARIKDAVVSENGKNVARDIVEMTHAV
ncbi:unnamed protein product [Caenorhabditis angaria]|uniref:Phospholipase A-2-activating protein n=1 Tax=Caenorhabditis angaria TaxID=860376 RepID=A0A9P1I9Y1_9PELO|nr:unnamed protein product [Caenorhabditis angaria]